MMNKIGKQSKKRFIFYGIISTILTALIIITAWLIITPTPNKSEGQPIKSVYDDDFFSTFLSNEKRITDLVYSYNEETKEATLIDLNLVGKNETDLENAFSGILSVPQTVVQTVNGVDETYNVTGINFNQRVSAEGTYESAIKYIKGIQIPKTVTNISEGSFWGFGSIVYFESPFVGTERGSSAFGMDSNFTVESKPFVSMFKNISDPSKRFFGFDIEDYSTRIDSLVAGWYELRETEAKAFFYPGNLKKIVITDDHAIGNHALFNLGTTDEVTSDYVGVTSIEIQNPSSLRIGNFAMAENPALENVVLPQNQTSISTGLFGHSFSLKSVKLPADLTSIPEGCFEECKALEEVLIPSSIQTIEKGAFIGCNELRKLELFSATWDNKVPSEKDISLPNSLESIGRDAFSNCFQFTSIVVPNNVKSIGASAFAGCVNLVDITLPFVGAHAGDHNLNCNTADEDYLYHGLFGYIFSKKAASAGTYDASQMFDSSNPIKKVIFYIPKTLKSVNITNETNISFGAFQGLTSLTSIIINDGITSITAGSFKDCTALKNLSVPFITGGHLGVMFGKLTDYSNNSITDVNGYKIPTSLENIKITNQPTIVSNTFHNCTMIKRVEITEETQYMQNGVFHNNPVLEELILPFVGNHRGECGSSRSDIDDSYYWWWRDKAWRNTLQWIFSSTKHAASYENNSLRYYDGYIKYIPNSLKSVTITDETIIGGYSFRSFKSLTNISITNDVSHIETHSMTGCSNLISLTVPFIGANYNPNGNAGKQHVLGWFFGTSEYSNSYNVSQYGSYYIPKSLTSVTIGEKSNKIFDYAFANCSSISSVFTNAQITELGKYAFYGCTKLSTLDTPNAIYTNVADFAFYNCKNLIDISEFIPSTVSTIGKYAFSGTAIGSGSRPLNLDPYTSINNYAFANCLQLQSVVIPTTVLNLGEGVFQDCQYLDSVNLLSKKLTKNLFKNCINLDSIDIRGITAIPEGAFSGCKSLTYDDGMGNGLIQDSLTTSIGAYAFYNCESLDKFIISNKTTSIGSFAFSGCTGLENMTIPKETKVIDSNGWDDCDPNFYFYVYLESEDWHPTWVENWNCYYPVYVIGHMNDTLFTYEYITEYKAYKITGLEDGINLDGTVTIPSYHNGLRVVAIDSSGKNKFTSQKGIKTIILPSSIFEIGKNTFANGKRVDIYIESLKSNIEDIYETSNSKKGWEIGFAEENWVSCGLIFYKNDWEYGTGTKTSIPHVKTSSLVYEFDRSSSNTIYNGRAITPKVVSIKLPAIIVENAGLPDVVSEYIEELDIINFSYSNNISAGTAFLHANINEGNYKAYNADLVASGINPVFLIGSGNQSFTIQKAVIDLFMPDNIFETTKFTTTYGGKQYSISSWGSYVQGLNSFPGASFRGTISTTSENSGTYTYNSFFDDVQNSFNPNNGNFVWTSPWEVYRNGVRITTNFEIKLYLTVEIKRQDVTIDWTGGQWDEDGDYYLYPYTGDIIEPSARALMAGTQNVLKNCEVIAKTDGTTGKLPQAGVSYKAYAYLANEQNYRLVRFDEVTNDYIEVEFLPYGNQLRRAYSTDYKIVNGKVYIDIDLNHVIGPNEDFWSMDLSRNGRYIQGLGAGSIFNGKLRSSGDKQINYIFNDLNNSIIWEQTIGEDGYIRDFHIYRYATDGVAIIDETSYYDVIVKATVRISYAEFEVEFAIANADTGSNKTIYTPNVVVIDGRLWVKITYSIDGNPYRLTANPSNYNGNQPYSISYFKTEDGSQIVGANGLLFKEVGQYRIGVTITGRHFKDYQMGIDLTAQKSEYKIDSLTREYNRYQIDPFEEAKILKYDIFNNVLTFTYYNRNRQEEISSPSEIGKYSVLISAPATPYFKEIDMWMDFEIIKRYIKIDITGNKMYDGNNNTWTPISSDLISKGYLLGADGNYLADEFVGTLNTIGSNPGIYDENFVYWSPIWGVFSTDGSNHTSNYQIVIIGQYEINYRKFTYTKTNYVGNFDGSYHSGSVNVSDPTSGYNIYYSEKAIPTGKNDYSSYSKYNFTYSNIGEYEVYFVIVAPNYENVFGSFTVIINKLEIDYYDPAMDSQPYDEYVVDYSGKYQQYKIDIIEPWNAIVYYSLDGKNWDTQAFEYKEIGSYYIYYKIEAPNYEIVGPKRVQFIISDEHLPELDKGIYTVNSYDGEYDGFEHSVTVNAPIPTGGWVNIFYSLDNTSNSNWTTNPYKFIDAGHYDVYVKIVAKGFKTLIIRSYVNIDKITFKNISITNYIGNYDGLAHMVSINGLTEVIVGGVTKYYYNGVEVTISYTSNQDVVSAGYGWSEKLSYTDVGLYKVWLKISAPNYEDLILGDGINVGIIEITVLSNPTGRIEYQEIEYSTFNSNSLVIDTVQDGVRKYYYYLAYSDNGVLKCDFSQRTTQPQELGLYYVRVEFLPSKNSIGMVLDPLDPQFDNYLTPEQEATDNFFKIIPKELHVEWKKEVYYDGNSHSPEPKVKTETGDEIKIYYELISPNVLQPIECGEYTFRLSIYGNNPNYVLDIDEITMVIKKRKLNIELREEKQYDGYVWSRNSQWNLLGITLLSGHEFVATMETNYPDVAEYFYSTTNTGIYSNKVLVTWDIVLEGTNTSVKDYYEVDFDIIVEIAYPLIDLSSIEDTIVSYDGEPHTVKIDLIGALNGATVMYKQENGNWTFNPIPQTYASTYSIEIQVSKPGFKTTTGTVQLIIEKADLDIEINDLDDPNDPNDDTYAIYDSTAKITTYNVKNVAKMPNATGEIGHVRYYSSDKISLNDLRNFYNNFDANSSIYLKGLTSMVDAGQYYCVVYYADTANQWNESYKIKNLYLKQRDINVDFNIPFSYESEYNKQKVSIYLKDAVIDLNALINGHSITSPLNRSTVRTNSANAGIYNPKIDFEFGEIFIDDGYGNNVSHNYHPVLSDNVFVKILKTYLTVDDFIVEDFEKEYDGEVNSPKIITSSDGKVCYEFFYYPDGDLTKNPIICSPSDFQTDVGVYKVGIYLEEGTNYYSSNTVNPLTNQCVGTLYATVTVTKKTQTIVWEDNDIEFTGSKESAKAHIIDVYDQKIGLEVFYFDKGNNEVDGFIAAGSYEANARFAAGYEIYSKNYELANPLAIFIIRPVIYEIRLGSDSTGNNVSTGNSQTPWSMAVKSDSVKDFPDFLVLKNSVGLDARIYTVSSLPGSYSGNSRFTQDIRVYTKDGLDVTASINFNIYGTVTIFATQITFTTTNKMFTYSEGKSWTLSETKCLSITYPTSGYSISYIIDGEPTIIEPRFSDVGIYTVQFTIKGPDGSDYVPVQGSVTIEIIPKESYLEFTESISKEYDGNPISPSNINLTESSGFNGGKEDLVFNYFELVTDPVTGITSEVALGEEPIDAGKYILRITCDKDNSSGLLNYTELNVSQEFTISPKKYRLTVDEDIQTEDSILGTTWTLKEQKGATGTDLMSGDEIEYEIISGFALIRNTFTAKKTFYSSSSNLTGNQEGIFDATLKKPDSNNNNKLPFEILWRITSTSRKDDTNTPLNISNNYYIELDFKLYTHYEEIEATITGESCNYDGLGHFGSISITKPISNVVQKYSLDSSFSEPSKIYSEIDNVNLRFVNPGKYTVYYVLSADQFEDLEGSFDIIISYMERDVSIISSNTKVYDENPMFKLWLNGSNYYLPEFIMNTVGKPNDDFDPSLVKIVYQRIGSSKKIDPTVGCIEAGTYRYTLTIPQSTFYKEIIIADREIIITQRTLLVTDNPNSLVTAEYSGSSVFYNDFTANSKYQINQLDDDQLTLIAPPSGLSIVGFLITNGANVGIYTGADNSLSWFNYEYQILKGNIDVSSNYNVSIQGASITIVPAEMNYNNLTMPVGYDESHHTLKIEMVKPLKYDAIYYFDSNRNAYVSGLEKFINVGNHVTKIKIESKNYQTVEVEFEVIIERATPDIKILSNLSQEYNGQEVLIPENITEHKELGITDYTFRYYEWNESINQYEYISEIIWDKNTSNWVVSDSALPISRPVNVGKYQIVVSIPASTNFKGIEIVKDFEIWSKNVVVEWSNTNFTYDGTPKSPTAYISLAAHESSAVPLIYTYVPKVNGDSTHTNVGVYEVSVEIDTAAYNYGNYTLSGQSRTCLFSIATKNVTITLNATRKYGLPTYQFKYNDPLNPFSAIGLVDKHTVSGTLQSKYNTVNTYTSINDFEWKNTTTDSCIIRNDMGIDVTKNYKISYSLKLLINYSDIEISAEPVEVVYDGLPHQISIVNNTIGDFTTLYSLDGINYSTTNPSFINVNMQGQNISPYIVYYRVEKTGDPGYNPVNGFTTVTILPKQANLQLDDIYQNPKLDKIYDGKKVVNPAVKYDSISGDGSRLVSYKYYRIVNGDVSVNPLTSNPDQAGNYKLVISVDGDTNGLYNYEKSTLEYTFTISKRAITIYNPKETKIFDTYVWKINISDCIVNNLVPTHSIQKGTLKTSSMDANRYYQDGDFVFENALYIYDGAIDVTENYEASYDLDVTITKAPITAEGHDYYGIYDTLNHTILGIDVLDSEIIDSNNKKIIINKPLNYTITYSENRNGPYTTTEIFRKSVGTTLVFFKIEADNYEPFYGEASINIQGLDVPGKDDDPNMVYDKNFIYNGQTYPTPSFTSASNGVQTVTYYLDSEFSNNDFSNPLTSVTEAGSYVFVINVATDGVYAAFQVKQAFEIKPRPIEVKWEGLEFTFGSQTKPSATYTDVFGKTIDCLVDFFEVEAGTYTVIAKTSSNYEITNSPETVTIKKLKVPEIVIDPSLNVTYGDELVVMDTDGNIYILDTDGTILEIQHPDGTSTTNPDLPYKIIIDSDKDADGVNVPTHTLTVQFNETDSEGYNCENNYEWETKGNADDIEVNYIINPIIFPNDKYKLDYQYQYQWIWDNTQTAIEPLLTVYLLDKETNSILENLILDKDFEVKYSNNTGITTDDNLAEILVSGINNYTFDSIQKFQILANPPSVLELKNDATIQFITADYDDSIGVEIVEESVPKRTAQDKSNYNFYLGKLYQNTFVSDVIAQFANDLNKLKVFNSNEIEISSDDYTKTYFGTGYTIKLYDDTMQEIDSIISILYGDLNGDGLVNAIDAAVISNITAGIDNMSNMLPHYYFAGIVDRNTMAFVNATAYAMLSLYTSNSIDSNDFNYNFKPEA